MWQVFRSLRFRLVVTFVAVVGMINALLGLGGIAFREWQLRTRFDEALERYASRLVLWLNRGEDGPRRLADQTRPFFDDELFVVVRRADGTVLDASRNLGGALLPLSEEALAAARGEAWLETVPRGGSAASGAGDEPVRVLTRLVSRPGQPDFLLQVGWSTREIEESLAFLRALFWIVVPAGLFAAALAAWIVTGRALGRLNVVSQLASAITPEHLDQRIDLGSASSRSGRGDEISRVVDEVNHMLGRLERSFKAQEQFIANASHELQTPVAVLLSEAQLIQRQKEASLEEYRRFARSVEQEMRQLSRMVGSLLSLTRMQSGDLVRSGKLQPLQELLVTAVDECCGLAQSDGITIQVDLPRESEAPAELLVRGDPQLLRIMLENLLRNAVRHSRRGDSVSVALEVDGADAIVTVTDRGSAIPGPAIASVFSRSAEAVAEPGARGGGLGLAIAQTVAELHGGALGVRNEEGGVSFFVWLPLAEEPQASGAAAAESGRPAA